MAIIPCKYKNNDHCEYEGVPVAVVSCQECLKDCEWQCTLYTGEDRVELRNSLLTGLKEKDQPADAIKKTMELYKNCSDDEYDYCSVCYEAALIHLFRNHPEVLSEAEADEADRILKSYIEE